MMQRIQTVTAPSKKPVTLSDAREQVGLLDDDSWDVMLERCITVATGRAERFTGRRFMTQVVDVHLEDFPVGRRIALPYVYPIASVDSVLYDDENGTEQTLAASEYWTDLLPVVPSISLRDESTWPTTQSGKPTTVRIRCTVGVAEEEDVDAEIRQAILLLTADLFNNREDTGEVEMRNVPNGFFAMLEPHVTVHQT